MESPAPGPVGRELPATPNPLPAAQAHGLAYRVLSAAHWFVVPLVSLWLVCALYGIDRQNVEVPTRYEHDIFPNVFLVKVMMETGWWMEHPGIGYPGRMEMYDYPWNPNLHMLLLKGLGKLTGEAFLAVDLYFLLGFPMISLSVLFLSRQLGFHPLVAGSFAILYAFTPFHLWRGVSHLFLSAYFMLPLILSVFVWLGTGVRLFAWDRAKRVRVRVGSKGCLALGIVFAAGFDFPYTPVFAGMLMALVTLRRALSAGRATAVLPGAVLLGTLCLGFLINMAPNLRHKLTTAPNVDVNLASTRSWAQSEVYALRTTLLLMPTSQHTYEPFRKLAAKYQTENLIPGTNECGQNLGVLAALGFIVLVLRPVAVAGGGSPVVGLLSALTLASLLIGTTSGFGAYINLTTFGLLRCYERLSIWIFLFALAGVACLANRMLTRSRTTPGMLVRGAVILTVGWLAFRDQTSSKYLSDAAHNAELFQRDRDFVRAIEAVQPPDTAIWQLPHQTFLSISGPCIPYDPYTHMRGYLHSRAPLRWSYGAICGRRGSGIQELLSLHQGDDLLERLCAVGFGGVYVEKRGLAEKAAVTIEALRKSLGSPLVETPDGELLYFSLDSFRERWFARTDEAKRLALKTDTLEPVTMSFSGKIDAEEKRDDLTWRWAGGDGGVRAMNYGSAPVKVRLTLGATAYDPTGAVSRFTVTGPRLAEPVEVPISCAGLSQVSMELTLPPGETDLKLHSDAKVYELARPLCYSIRNYKLERVE